MPKVELHVHLIGSISDETAGELLRRHHPAAAPVPRPLAGDGAARSFGAFAAAFGRAQRLVRTGADLVLVIDRLARDLVAANVLYAEVTVTPLAHLAAGIDPDELVEALARGRAGAATAGVELAWVFDVSGELGAQAALDTVRWVLHHAPEDAVGFGLGGPEAGVPRRRFRSAFEAAIAAGLHSVPHAGESSGPESVRSALGDLRAERIGHGIGSARDPRLVAELAAAGVTLEICPTSNLRTGVVPEPSEHPLAALLRAGVPVTLGTDDPGIFRTDLNREYVLAHEQLGLTRDELVEIAATGIRAAFCRPALRRELAGRLRAFLAAERTRA